MACKKAVKLLNCGDFDIEAGRIKLKSVTSCSELVREISSRMLENQGFMKEEVRIEERRHAGESVTYQKRLVEVLKRQFLMCP